MIRVAVPLWLALSLRSKSKCDILKPGWLNQDSLTAILKKEEDTQKDLCEDLPIYYFEIARLIGVTPNERRLLQDIYEIRIGKSRRKMSELSEDVLEVRYFNSSLFEIK